MADVVVAAVSGAPDVLAVGAAGSEGGEAASASGAALSASSNVLESVRAPPVRTTALGSFDRVAGCGVSDSDVSWLIGKPVDLSVDPDAVDGAVSDESDMAAVLAPAAPFGAASDDELVPESAGSAHVTAGVLASAIPIPSATANAPTRPTNFAAPIVVPLSMSRRNEGQLLVESRSANRRLRCGATSAVVHYCNFARFRRGTTEIPRVADDIYPWPKRGEPAALTPQ